MCRTTREPLDLIKACTRECGESLDLIGLTIIGWIDMAQHGDSELEQKTLQTLELKKWKVEEKG